MRSRRWFLFVAVRCLINDSERICYHFCTADRVSPYNLVPYVSSPVSPVSPFFLPLPSFFFFAGRLPNVCDLFRFCFFPPKLHVHIIVEYKPKLIVKKLKLNVKRGLGDYGLDEYFTREN